MKDFIESDIFYKRCDNRTMNGKLFETPYRETQYRQD